MPDVAHNALSDGKDLKPVSEPKKYIDAKTHVQSAMLATMAVSPLQCLEVWNKRLQLADAKLSDLYKDPVKRNLILFQDAHDKSIPSKIRSSFAGYKWGLGNKMITTSYLKVGQQEVNKRLEDSGLNDSLQAKLGKRKAKTAQEAISGSIVGACEVILTPIDVVRIQLMTNPAMRNQIKTTGMPNYIWQQRGNLYKASSLAVPKNALNYGLFFGAEDAAKLAMGIDDKHAASPSQIYLATSAGTVASIVGTNPLDVIKTRTQSPEGKTSIADVVKKSLDKESIATLAKKGLLTKFAIRGSKTALMFGTAEILANKASEADQTGSTFFKAKPSKIDATEAQTKEPANRYGFGP